MFTSEIPLHPLKAPLLILVTLFPIVILGIFEQLLNVEAFIVEI